MKLIYLTFIAIIGITLSSFTTNAQFGNCCPYINPIEISPASPTNTDDVKIITNITTPNYGEFISKSFYVSQDTIYLEACYFGGFLTVLRTFVDTFDIGTLSAGTYQVALTAHISDNDTLCSSYDFSLADTSFTVSDNTNSLPVHAMDDIEIVPNPSDGAFEISVKDASSITYISISTTDGKVTKTMNYEPHLTLSLSPGVYIVQFYNRNEFLGTKRLVIH